MAAKKKRVRVGSCECQVMVHIPLSRAKKLDKPFVRGVFFGVLESIRWRICCQLKERKEKKRNASRRSADAAEECMNLAFQFRGKPTREQEQYFRQNIGNCRFLWNTMLGDYLKKGKFETPATYKKRPGMEWLKLGDSLALANVQLNLQAAIHDYQAGEKGKPHFKKKKVCKDSFKTNLSNKENPNLYLDGNLLHLPKLKAPVRLVLHREIPAGGVLKNCTVTHEKNGEWMFSLVFEYEKVEVPFSGMKKPLSQVMHIGLDMSLPKLYIDSNGNEADFYKPYRKLEQKIAREQRRLSRMKYGSNNYIKQKQYIAKLHAKVKHQREDMLHKLSCMLTDQYDLISIEDLDLAAMKKSLHFGKSVSDNGWGKFVEMLEYKAERKGKLVLRVDKWFPSSKTCSCCGHVHKELKMKDRMYECPVCGNLMDRDHQAAVNIDREGFRIFQSLYELFAA